MDSRLESSPLNNQPASEEGFMKRMAHKYEEYRLNGIAKKAAKLNAGRFPKDGSLRGANVVVTKDKTSVDIKWITLKEHGTTTSNVSIAWDGPHSDAVPFSKISATTIDANEQGEVTESRLYDSSQPRDTNTMTVYEIDKVMRKAQYVETYRGLARLAVDNSARRS